MDIIYKYYKKEYKNLTKAEKKIIEFIVKNPKKVVLMSALDIGKEIGLSDASVLRFSKKIGFEKFSDLKNLITQELSYYQDPNERIISHWDNFNSEDSLVNKIIDTDLKNMQQFLSEIDLENLKRAVELLDKSKKVYYVGLGPSRIISQYMYWYSRRIGMNCEHIFEGSISMYETIQNMKKDELIFICSFPKFLKDEIKLIEFAKEKKLKIISITNNIFSEISLLSDITFRVFIENQGFFNSYIIPIELCHLILTSLFEKNKEKIYSKIKENEHIKKIVFE